MSDTEPDARSYILINVLCGFAIVTYFNAVLNARSTNPTLNALIGFGAGVLLLLLTVMKVIRFC